MAISKLYHCDHCDCTINNGTTAEEQVIIQIKAGMTGNIGFESLDTLPPTFKSMIENGNEGWVMHLCLPCFASKLGETMGAATGSV